jgi:hypothetical protein
MKKIYLSLLIFCNLNAMDQAKISQAHVSNFDCALFTDFSVETANLYLHIRKFKPNNILHGICCATKNKNEPTTANCSEDDCIIFWELLENKFNQQQGFQE